MVKMAQNGFKRVKLLKAAQNGLKCGNGLNVSKRSKWLEISPERLYTGQRGSETVKTIKMAQNGFKSVRQVKVSQKRSKRL